MECVIDNTNSVMAPAAVDGNIDCVSVPSVWVCDYDGLCRVPPTMGT